MFLENTLRKGLTAHSPQSFGNVGSIAAGRFALVDLGVKLGRIGERSVPTPVETQGSSPDSSLAKTLDI